MHKADMQYSLSFIEQAAVFVHIANPSAELEHTLNKNFNKPVSTVFKTKIKKVNKNKPIINITNLVLPFLDITQAMKSIEIDREIHPPLDMDSINAAASIRNI